MYPWQSDTCAHVGLHRRQAGFGAGILCCRVGTCFIACFLVTRIRTGKVLLADFRQLFKDKGLLLCMPCAETDREERAHNAMIKVFEMVFMVSLFIEVVFKSIVRPNASFLSCGATHHSEQNVRGYGFAIVIACKALPNK